MEKADRFLYVLQLENNAYYIGQTQNLKKRVEKHMKGKGAAWTRMNKPIKLIEYKKFESMTYQEMELLENILTVEYMKKYNWKNVRGVFFSDSDSSRIREKLIRFSKDLPKEIIESI